MPASAFTPDVVVEIGFGYGYATPLASIVWTDVSAYVEAQMGVTITRGRTDEFSDVSPSQLTLTLDNRDARFTAKNTGGAYYPNVKLGTPIRVTATWSAVVYRRFTGYVSEWPVQWPQATSGSAHATVRAASRTARLGRDLLAYPLAEHIVPDAPDMWYPLSEGSDSRRAFNHAATAQNPLTITGSDGTVTFGQEGGAPFDGLSAVTLHPTASPGGKSLSAPILNQPATGQPRLALECWVTTTSTATTNTIVMLYSSRYLTIEVRAGVAFVGILNSAGVDVGSFTGVTVNDGEPHHIAILNFLDGAGNVARSAVVDGVLIDLGTTAVGYNTFSDFQRLNVGRDDKTNNGNPPDATIGQVAVYGGATIPAVSDFQDHYSAGFDGFEGDTSDERNDRILAWGGLSPGVDYILDAGSTVSMSGAAVEGQSVYQAILDVSKTENGIVYDGGDGVVQTQGRQHRYNATAAATLAASTQQVEADLLPKMDDQSQINRQTVALPSGYTATAEDTASIASYGVYAGSSTILSTVEDEADSAAQYRVNVYAQPLVRVPQCTVQLIAQDSTTVANILGVELGDLVTLTGLPTQAPTSSMDFFVEGYTEVIGSEGQGWVWTANLSPGDIPGDAWTLGTSDLTNTTTLGY